MLSLDYNSKHVEVSKKELNQILQDHKLWLESKRMLGKQANLQYTNLYNVDLSGVDLRHALLDYASLEKVNLKEANLSYTSLRHTIFKNVNLTKAKLVCSSLTYAFIEKTTLLKVNLSESQLQGVTFTSCYLQKINLQECNLFNGIFYNVDLQYSNLTGANLRLCKFTNSNLKNVRLCNSNLSQALLYNINLENSDMNNIIIQDADLSRIQLHDVKHLPPIICPEEGSFIGFKKASYNHKLGYLMPCIVKLKITENAKRSSATNKKCRCSEAQVLEVTTIEGEIIDTEAMSWINNKFKYKVGETVKVDNFDENRWNECSTGIHFFLTRQEAIDYVL